MTVAKRPVVTAELSTSVYDVVRIMSREGFRRIPIVEPRSDVFQGIITSTDIVDYLGGGPKFNIIQRELSGSFFKAINAPAKFIMQPNAPTVEDSATIRHAIELMQRHEVGGLPIVDNSSRVLAIVTERDMLAVFAEKAKEMRVDALMTRNVITGSDKTTILEAEKEMVDKGFRRLPLIAEGRLVGVVTAMDIVRFFGSGEVFQHLRSGTILQVLQTPALQIGSTRLVTTTQESKAAQAAGVMIERRVGALLVVEDEKLVGMLTERDFFKLASRAS